MATVTPQIIQKISLDILKAIPHKPFLCLPLSALLYANLKDAHGVDAKLVTGDVTYKDKFIFKQDFKISNGDYSKFKLWGGHAWVEVEGSLWDLSFFRTLYSEKFTKPYKQELIQFFGLNKGLLAFSGRKLEEINFEYHPVEILSDTVATGIIQGIEALLKIDW